VRRLAAGGTRVVVEKARHGVTEKGARLSLLNLTGEADLVGCIMSKCGHLESGVRDQLTGTVLET